MISTGQSWSSIQAATGCSRATIAKLAKRLRQAPEQGRPERALLPQI
jgi:hypothetical protein